MPNTFKAIVIDNQNENFSREVKEIDQNFLGDNEVLVKVCLLYTSDAADE